IAGGTPPLHKTDRRDHDEHKADSGQHWAIRVVFVGLHSCSCQFPVASSDCRLETENWRRETVVYLASITRSGDFVGTIRVSSKPAPANRSRNSCSVRSRPP